MTKDNKDLLSDLNPEVEVTKIAKVKEQKTKQKETITLSVAELENYIEQKLKKMGVSEKADRQKTFATVNDIKNAEIKRKKENVSRLNDEQRVVFSTILNRTRENNKEISRIINEIILPYERANKKPISFGEFAIKCPDYELMEMNESDFIKVPGDIMINGRKYYPEPGKKFLVHREDIDILRSKLRFDPQRPAANTPYARKSNRIKSAKNRSGELDDKYFKAEKNDIVVGS
jgi:hypothetical protein